jgi:hypothetical protein
VTSPAPRLRPSLPWIAVVVACAGFASACAQRLGKEATAGALSEIERQRAEHPDQRPMLLAAESVVQGVVGTLDRPEERARLDRIVSEAASAGARSTIDAFDQPEQRARIARMISEAVAAATHTAVQQATREMVVSLGPEGQGPLAVSMSRAGERVAASTVGGVGGQLAALVPECTGPDQMECIERRLQRSARTTAASFTSGVKDAIGWQLLFIVFVLGAAGGVLGAWLWSLRHYRRRTLRMADA